MYSVLTMRSPGRGASAKARESAVLRQAREASPRDVPRAPSNPQDGERQSLTHQLPRRLVRADPKATYPYGLRAEACGPLRLARGL